MNNASATHLSWFALAAMVVTTAANAPIFMGGSDGTVTEEQGLSVEFVGDARPVAFASTAAAELLLSLTSDATQPVSLDPWAKTRLIDIGSLEYMADSRSADQGIADGANAIGGFAGSEFVGTGARSAIAPSANFDSTMSAIGGYRSDIPKFAAGRSVAIDTSPRSSNTTSDRPDRGIATSSRMKVPIEVLASVAPVAEVEQGLSPRSTLPDDWPATSALGFPTIETSNSSPVRNASPPKEWVTSAAVPGRTPGILDTGPAVAFGTHAPLTVGLERLQQLTADAAKESAAEENIAALAVMTTSPITHDASPALLSLDVPSAAPLAVPEPGTLALVGLSLALTGLCVVLRKT